MTKRKALSILLQAAQNDVEGSGRGIRSTSDDWRKQVTEAWMVVFKMVNHRAPDGSDLFNAGLMMYARDSNGHRPRQ